MTGWAWTPLPWAIIFSLSGRLRDMHPLDSAHAGRITTKASGIAPRGFLKKDGSYLLSHGCAVPSARAGLTSLFGMGRGGTPPL